MRAELILVQVIGGPKGAVQVPGGFLADNGLNDAVFGFRGGESSVQQLYLVKKPCAGPKAAGFVQIVNILHGCAGPDDPQVASFRINGELLHWQAGFRYQFLKLGFILMVGLGFDNRVFATLIKVCIRQQPAGIHILGRLYLL